MVFSSIFFLCIFLPVMLVGYYLLPKAARNVWLLLGSLFFYAFSEPKYLLLMLASITGNYVFGMLCAKLSSKRKVEAVASKDYIYGKGVTHELSEKITIAAAVVFNLGLLVYFKYFTLLCTTVNDLFNAGISIPEIVLPIGISFYTFQGMSYVIDVYRMENALDENGKKISIVQKNPINLALYISMFPQLIAGPIVRYTDIMDRIKVRDVSVSDFAEGIERFIVGLAKKALLANMIGEIADEIFACDTAYMGTGVAWLGAVCYTLQIFYDFSGYSDMAIGLGRMFGFRFMENFNYPYISKSITEFWRRWHISLSTWFKDYLYIPLGGNRSGIVYLNLLVVFLATGIWHGAEWGFLIWGLWHGIFILLERMLKKKNVQIKVPGFVKWIYTMLVVVLGWVLFKLEDIVSALSYLGVMFHTHSHEYNAFELGYYLNGRLIFILIMAVIVAIPWAQVLPRHIAAYLAEFLSATDGVLVIVRRVLLVALLLISMICIMNNTYNPFIYFRF